MKKLMQKKKLLISLSLLCFATILLATNTMALMATLCGENIGDQFGASIVAIDFNGDGYDDLVVKAHGWDPPDAEPYPQYLPYGKIYYFMGGEDFNSEPDYEFEGQYPRHLGNAFGNEDMAMINAGDMNGDGIDDLIVPEKQGMGFSSSISLSVYFGKDIPTATPDRELIFPLLPDWVTRVDVFPLGDINGDGLADVSIWIPLSGKDEKAHIWSDVFGEPELCEAYPITWITGVGDVNMDGYSDMVKYAITGTYDAPQHDFTLYYGDQDITLSDSLLIGTSYRPVDQRPGALGDINGDGYPDFFAFTDKVWFGGESISVTPNVIMDHQPWIAFDRGMRPSVINGDVNGDGYPDFIASYHEMSFYDGQAGVWLGGANFNGTRDILLQAPNYIGRNFGWCKAAGDFNGDGYCDIAISAPWWTSGHEWNTEGRVFVFAGNPELEDTTVGNDDPAAPSAAESWQLNVYPNPGKSGSHEWSVEFSGKSSNADLGALNLCIANLRGQIVHKQHLSLSDILRGNLQLSIPRLPAGIYLMQIKSGKITKVAKKLTIL